MHILTNHVDAQSVKNSLYSEYFFIGRKITEKEIKKKRPKHILSITQGLSLISSSADPIYAGNLLTHAQSLFEFAEKFRGLYSDSIPNVAEFYQ